MKPEELNPENDPEVRITALLLGELTAEEETELRAVMAQNPELTRLHDRLKVVMGLVKDAVPTTEPLTQSLPEPMTLAEERRAELLAVFKGQAPKPKEKIIKVSFWQRQKADLLKLAAMLVGLLAVTWVMLPKRQRANLTIPFGRMEMEVARMRTADPASASDPFYSVPAKSEPEVELTTVDTTAAKKSDDEYVIATMATNAISFSAVLGDASPKTIALSTLPAGKSLDNIASTVRQLTTPSSSYAVQDNRSSNPGANVPAQRPSVRGNTAGVPIESKGNREGIGSQQSSIPTLSSFTGILTDPQFKVQTPSATRGSQIALPALAAADGEQEVTRKTMADPNGRTVANSFSSFQNDGAIVSGNSLALNDSIAGKPMASPGQSGPAGDGGLEGRPAVDSVKLSLETQAGRGLENGDLKYKSTAAKKAVSGKFQFGVGVTKTFGGDEESDQKNTTEAVAQNSLNVKDKVPVLGDLPVMDFSYTTQLNRQAKEGQSGQVAGGGVGGGGAGGQTQWGFGTQNGRRGAELANGPQPNQSDARTVEFEKDFAALPQSQMTQLGLEDSRKLAEGNKPREMERLSRPEPAMAGSPGNNDMFLGGAFKSALAPGQIVGSGGTQPSVTANEYSAMGRTVNPGQVVELLSDGINVTTVSGRYVTVDAGKLGMLAPEDDELKMGETATGRSAPMAGEKVDAWRKAREEYQPEAGAKEKAPVAQQTVNGLVIAGTTVDINGGARSVLNGEMKGVSQLGADASGVTLNYAAAPEMPRKPGAVDSKANNFAFYDSLPAQPAPATPARVNRFVGRNAYVTGPDGKTLPTDQYKDSLAENGAVHADSHGDRAKLATLGDAQKDVFFDSPAATPTPATLPQSKDLKLRLMSEQGVTLADSDGDGTKVMSQKQDGFNLDVVDLTVSQKLDNSGLEMGKNGGSLELSYAVTPPATPSSGPVDASAKGKKQEVSQKVQDAKLLMELRRTAEAEVKLKQALKEDPENKAAHYYMELAQEQKFGDASRKRDYEQRSKIVQAGGIPDRSEDLPVANPYARNDMAKIELPTAQGLSVEELKKGVTVTRRLEVDKLKAVNKQDEKQVEEFAKLSVEAKQVAKDEPAPPRPPAAPAGIPQPEVSTAQNAFSTFSLNVSDVSFKLAAASLEKGLMPEPATVRTEEFINAFNYHDAEPTGNARVAFAWERARYPFAHDRDLVRFAVKTGAVGREPGKPLNIVLLLDNSGSMERADRVQIRRECLRVLGGQLQAQDTVSVVAFARTARLWVDGLAGNKAEELQERVGNLTPEGGTNLEEAMNLAYATAQKHFVPNGVNRVVLLTDGAANLGDVSPDSLKKKVVSYRQQGVALDCFGIGWEGYNDDLLEALSRNGDGRYGFVNSPEAATTEFASQLVGALQVAASDVKVQVEWNPKRVTVFRQLGYAKHQLKKEEFRDNKVDAAEIGAAEAGNALYTVQVNPAGEGPLGVVRVRYRVPNTSDYREHEWTLAYDGASKPMEQSSVPLRLAATASAFSEWLVASPFAGEVTAEGLITQLSGVPEAYPADPRPKQLEWMIRQAKSLSGR